MDPHKKMDEYCGKKDPEKIREFQGKTKQEELTREKDERKKLHYMHCPKCGAKMETICMDGVEIDKCPECLGLYFDNHELQAVLEKELDKRRTIFYTLLGL